MNSQGIKSITHTIGCLGKANEPLIVVKLDIKGYLFNCIVDTGATSSFIPLHGDIISHVKPILEETNGKVATLGSEINSTMYRTWLPIRPAHMTSEVVSSKVLVLNSGNQILGYDMIMGLPELIALNAEISFKAGEPEVIWHTRIQDEAPNQERQANLLALSTVRNDPAVIDTNSIVNTDPTRDSNRGAYSTQKQTSTEINHIIKKFQNVFANSLNGSSINGTPAHIKLYDYSPLTVRSRRRSPEEIREISEQVSRLEKNGIIEVSNSAFSSNCHLVPKKNGKQRLVINYKPINKVAIRDEYQIPMIGDIMGALVGQKIFTVLDATEGFHQVKLDEKSREFTAFQTPIGLFQYKRVPFGFVNSPAIFQRAINEVLRPGLFKKCAAYVDDIIIFGRTIEEHNSNLTWVLEQCEKHNLKINPAKCQFGKSEVTFLGRRLSEKGVTPVLDDLTVVADGANIYVEDHLARKVVEQEFEGVAVVPVPFYGQSRSNRCASSAAGIAIEFQRYHAKGAIPHEVRPSKVVFERINRSLHKIETPMIQGRKHIQKQVQGVSCPDCGKIYRFAKSRAVLNRHKCT